MPDLPSRSGGWALPSMAKQALKWSAFAVDRVVPPPNGVVVLIYHRVGSGSGLDVDLPVATFTDQMEQLAAFVAAVNPGRIFAVSTRGTARYDAVDFRSDDAVMFGSETSGLPQEVIDSIPAQQRTRLPMRPDNRSLNLSNAVAVVAFEAWRQCGFEGSV